MHYKKYKLLIAWIIITFLFAITLLTRLYLLLHSVQKIN